MVYEVDIQIILSSYQLVVKVLSVAHVNTVMLLLLLLLFICIQSITHLSG